MNRQSDAISVVIPAFNAAETIAAALESVQRQSHPAAELILVDDGSTDGTAVLAARAFEAIILLRKENGGPSSARNRGLARASGSLIAFLDADDIWPETMLETLLSWMRASEGAEIVQGLVQDFWPGDEADDLNLGPAYRGLNIGSALYRRTLFERIGNFDAGLRQGEDFEFWLRVRESSVPLLLVDEVALYYRRRSGSLRRRSASAIQNRLQAIKDHLDRQRGSSR